MRAAETGPRRIEIVVYRCACGLCSDAQAELGRLAHKYDAVLTVRRVDSDPQLEGYPAWRCPVVYVDGLQVSHYQVSPRKWEESLRLERASAPSEALGRVVDLHCFMTDEESHPECIRSGQPIGLATPSGDLLLLLRDEHYPDAYEALKRLEGEVRVAGHVYKKGGLEAVLVQSAALAAA